MGTDRRRPEILAPAGNMTCLQAAIDAGADAAYLGLGKFNMRARSSVNFSPEELPEAAARAHAAGVKLYLTLNSIIFESELDAMRGTIAAAAPHGADARAARVPADDLRAVDDERVEPAFREQMP